MLPVLHQRAAYLIPSIDEIHMIVEWVYSVFINSAVTAALLCAAAWLGRSQIAHWLNKDLESVKAKHQSDLAEANAGYQRGLEAYKVSLIAEAERVKASQDVRKAMAIKIAEKRFNSIDRLHKAFLATNLGKVAAIAELAAIVNVLNEEKFKKTTSEIIDGIFEISAASSDACQVLSPVEREAFTQYVQELINIASKLDHQDKNAAHSIYLESKTTLLELAVRCEVIFHSHLEKMWVMDFSK